MRVSILKLVFFSIIICSFEYAINELYYVNETSIHLERNLINFRNNRILTDADEHFDLNYFYESIVSFADQLNDHNDDGKDIKKSRNFINSHIKKYKESNTLPDLNNVDKKTKREIHKLQKELEEVKNELDNIRNDKLAIQPIQDKRIIIKGRKFSISNYEGPKGLEYLRSLTVNEQDEDDTNVEDIVESKRELERRFKGLMIRGALMILLSFVLLAPGVVQIGAAIIGVLLSIESIFRCYQYAKLGYKIPKKTKK
ncbi:fam-b protein [Plasmodium vinckei brucechwatti]|uniref:Fam-b protein n=1 Tax=Plasmodium vinckei brucechwatti TaxID=119398 RepID=A0A6V7SMU7_PLAVN|nr:fam-b protein [Plasmodium vinckei brucechwatti]